jgi:hypothetical protein
MGAAEIIHDDRGQERDRNVGGLVGILYTSAGFGTLVGPAAAGFAFDFSGRYTVPILVSIAGNGIAAAVMAITAWASPGDRGRATRQPISCRIVSGDRYLMRSKDCHTRADRDVVGYHCV